MLDTATVSQEAVIFDGSLSNSVQHRVRSDGDTPTEKWVHPVPVGPFKLGVNRNH